MRNIFYLLNQLSRKTIFMLYVLFICLIFFFFHYYYFDNKMSQINILNSTISNIQNEIQINEMGNIMSEAENLTVTLNTLRQRISPYLETYKIIDDLDFKIKKCNLSTIEFNLSQPQQVIINNDSNDIQTICILEISLRLSGDYESIRKMIDELLTAEYYYRISMLNISVAGDNLTELTLSLNSYSKELNKSLEEKTLDFDNVSNDINPFVANP